MRRIVALLLAFAATGATCCRAESVDVVILDGNGRALTPQGVLSIPGPDGQPYPLAGVDRLIVPDSPFIRSGGLTEARAVGTVGLPMASDLMVTPSPGDLLKNGLSAYFSSATGGIGFRIGYDRRISPVTRLIAGTEFITYGFQQALSKLGSDLPSGVTRVTLVAMPVGLQRQFYPKARVVPHVGFGAGPYLRFDHQAGPPGFYSGYNTGGLGIGAGTYNGNTGFGATVGLPLDDFPAMSLTVGGYGAVGFDFRFGERRDFALTVDGSYTVARFVDALGSPGDMGGPSLAVGVGKYF